MTAPNSAWSGWLKVGADGWQHKVISPSWDDCWRLLLQCASDVPPSDAPVACSLSVSMIVNDGRHPERRRRPR